MTSHRSVRVAGASGRISCQQSAHSDEQPVIDTALTRLISGGDKLAIP